MAKRECTLVVSVRGPSEPGLLSEEEKEMEELLY
jgi:hypothetical protein